MDTFRPDLFAGKHVVVAGASSGIGLAIARGFAAHGASVIGLGSSAAKISALAEDGISFRQIDLRNSDTVKALCSDIPRADVLINAAGVARPEAEWDEAGFLDVMEVNLNATMRLSFGLYPQLAEAQGSIVNVASMLSFLADASVPAYGASKTGILGFTRACAHRWGRQGIRVNAIAPGYHRTDMTQPIWSNPAGAAAVEARTALGRWGTAEDLVGATLFLCSPAAAYVTGVCLEVDGGFVSGNPL